MTTTIDTVVQVIEDELSCITPQEQGIESSKTDSKIEKTGENEKSQEKSFPPKEEDIQERDEPIIDAEPEIIQNEPKEAKIESNCTDAQYQNVECNNDTKDEQQSDCEKEKNCDQFHMESNQETDSICDKNINIDIVNDSNELQIKNELMNQNEQCQIDCNECITNEHEKQENIYPEIHNSNDQEFQGEAQENIDKKQIECDTPQVIVNSNPINSDIIFSTDDFSWIENNEVDQVKEDQKVHKEQIENQEPKNDNEKEIKKVDQADSISKENIESPDVDIESVQHDYIIFQEQEKNDHEKSVQDELVKQSFLNDYDCGNQFVNVKHMDLISQSLKEGTSVLRSILEKIRESNEILRGYLSN